MIQTHPDYHQGFYDAQDGIGLFEGCTFAYAAGWRAYWACWQALDALCND
ncbi:hypothetical protein [Brevundimonas sp. A19_0]|nr:hypothetical protein [Brevundimonas sp. A19_0]MBO9502035.1 hypothetical protein [Brevundimonas sp. A19_0]